MTPPLCANRRRRVVLAQCWRDWRRFLVVARTMRVLRRRVDGEVLRDRFHRWKVYMWHRVTVRNKALSVVARLRHLHLQRSLLLWRRFAAYVHACHTARGRH